MKKRMIRLLLAAVMVLGMVPGPALAANDSVQWAGSMNFNKANNQVTTVNSMTAANRTELKWQSPLNDTVIHGGAYYAGTQVIVGDYLYASGGNKLHKIDRATGTCAVSVSVPETAKLNEVQYLCCGGGNLYFAIRESITAYKLEDLSQVWTVSGNFGQYHPVQYLEYGGSGYLWCNGSLLNAADGAAVAIRQKDSDETLETVDFSWSSGARSGKYFYVTDKRNVYAIDMSTWKVADQAAYYEGTISSSYNTSGQVAYDNVSGRLFWGCKNYSTKNLYSIQVGEDGLFAADSLLSVDAGFTSVNLPVIHDGRVYLVGQGKPCVAVFDIDAQTGEISRSYTVGDASLTVQANPILSIAGGTPRLYFFGFDGALYVMEDKGESGALTKLAQSPNPSGVKFPNSYEQFAMDQDGSIYCYNESGYLFCYGKSLCELPSLTTDLSTGLQKVQLNAAAALRVEATVDDGGVLSYQWQESADGKNWSDVSGSDSASYSLPTAVEKTGYYRCIITNTKDGNTASTASGAAWVQVKELSANTSLHAAANTVNKLDGAVAAAEVTVDGNKIVYVENFTGAMKYLALGAADEGTFEPLKEKLILYQGLTAGTAMPSVSNVSNSDQYSRRYYRSAGFGLPFVAGVKVTAEDGISQDVVYVVVDDGALASYTVGVSGLTSVDTGYYAAETGISFTAAGQSVTLLPVTETIGSGEEDKTNWTWSSSDTTVAIVDAQGTVKSIGGGEAVIAFTCGQMTATCKVTSTAPAHTVHTYTDGKCGICGMKEPAAVQVSFTLVKDGAFVLAKDGSTELYEADVSVSDEDCDGTLTLHDAFLAAHKAYSANGTADFATEDSPYGAFITKLWGVPGSDVGYYHNGASASGLSVKLKANDILTAYFYRDLTDHSDIFSSIHGQSTVSAGNTVAYTVHGLANGAAVVPKNAAVKVYDSTKAEVAAMSTTVGPDGTAALTFAETGTYTVEVSGTAAYTGSVWDSSLNEGTGGYATKEFDAAPVIPSRMEVTVMPRASKTVSVSIASKNGSFAVNKNGADMWRFPVTASDDPANPDGTVTIKEVLVAAHEQYHADGSAALAGHTNNFITKLWGESNSGNCSYYFNDCYLSGGGTKTGTNGRPFRDKLLETAVEDGDHFYIYSFQSSDWSKGDLYTYFAPVKETATAGTAKTLTVKSAGGYGANANKLGTSLVTVTDGRGQEQPGLHTTVGVDGSFSITFPEEGTYTVEVRTNGSNYVTPSRCQVTVTAGGGSGGGSTSDRVTVSLSVADPNGGFFLKEREYTLEEGSTAADLLNKSGLRVVGSQDTDYGFYVESINGIGEFDQGSGSGWMYKVNGQFPNHSAALYELAEGDCVEWVYTRDLGEDVGGGPSGGGSAPSKQEQAALPFDDVSESDYFYDAVKWAVEKGITSGTSERTFSPHAACTRGQMVMFLWRAAGSPEPSGAVNVFRDVDEPAYYSKALRWAVQRGITSGTSATTFSPEVGCTRGQMATFLYRNAKSPAVSGVHPFEDVAAEAYYSDAVCWAKDKGITAGTSATAFSPDAICTRGQMVTFLYRSLAR